MDRVTQSPAVYDRLFSEGGHEGVYHLPYWKSAYYPLFKAVLRTALRHDVRSILEVGCGNGAFAHLLADRTGLRYRGFDFSPVAVQRAIARTGTPDRFYVDDATSGAAYERAEYDCIVCTEVLEHIEEDLRAVSHWRSGTLCICSVPNFDSETHVRFFQSTDDVVSRYGGLIDIESVIRIKKPVLADISMPSVLRALRWNRYRPRRLLEFLGVGSFESLGGWFLFCGIRR
ncbi:MAG TPA: class I SAM-dependent methyltransferase [Burkholderiales bacterium]